MLRSLIRMAVIVAFIPTSRQASNQTSAPTPAHNLYLPLSINAAPLVEVERYVEVVELGTVDWIDYPGYMCMYGYTTALTPSAVYSPTLAIEVTHYPYCEGPEGCPPGFSTHVVGSELYATLPGQKNPFSYCLLYAKNYYTFGEVALEAARLNPPDGRAAHPLTVTSLTKEGSGSDTTVSGTVRNDSGQRLADVRVVGIAGLCSPKEADLGVSELNPGQQSSYTFNHFYCAPPPYGVPVELLEISAQGLAAP
jgi:hypothetical protein